MDNKWPQRLLLINRCFILLWTGGVLISGIVSIGSGWVSQCFVRCRILSDISGRVILDCISLIKDPSWCWWFCEGAGGNHTIWTSIVLYGPHIIRILLGWFVSPSKLIVVGGGGHRSEFMVFCLPMQQYIPVLYCCCIMISINVGGWVGGGPGVVWVGWGCGGCPWAAGVWGRIWTSCYLS